MSTDEPGACLIQNGGPNDESSLMTEMMTVVETLDSDPKEKAPNPRVIIEKYMMKKLEIQQNQSMWIQSRRNMNEWWVLWERKLMTMNFGVEQQYKQCTAMI